MRAHDFPQIPLGAVSRPLLAAVVLAASAVVGAPLEETRPRNEGAIADVESGREATARASWWGFDPEDATRSLQAALDSRASRVIVDRMDHPWIVTTIQLPSDKEVIFEPGVVVEAKRGAFLGKGDCLFEARGRKRLTLRGEGATLRMHKSDYHKPPYALAEWRHALSIRGCEDVTVEGLTLAESGGDGIYLGAGADRSTNRNITIRNVDCDGHNRQGISVITAENLLIESCTFRNTRGTAPEAGIDFEPNHPEERLVSCVVRSCRSEDNAGHAYHIYLGQMNAESAPVSIRFEGCTSKGCERYSTYVGVANREGKRTVRGTIEYVRCRFDSDRGAGVYIRGNEADGCRVRFDECEIIRRDEPGSRMAPITIAAPAHPDVDAGNIELKSCRIRDELDRPPIALSASPLTVLRNVSGSLTVESSSRTQRYALDAEQLRRWFPAQGLLEGIPRLEFDWREAQPIASKVTAADADRRTFRLRRSATLLVWARAGREVRFTTTTEPVGRHTPTSRPIELTSPDGTVSELEPQARGDRTLYTFTPTTGGPHRLHWSGDPRETLRPLGCTEPLAILAEALGAHFIRPQGTLEFAVPSGVSRFGLVVTGAEPGETVKATVRNATREVVAERDAIAAPRAFVLERDDDTTTETWSITFERASEGVLEDVTLQMVGIPPLLGLCGDAPTQDGPLEAIPHERVELRGPFWGPRLKIHHEVTIPHALDCLERAGHVTNFDKAAGVFGGPLRGHHAFDSDLHKALEGALYSLRHHDDPELRRRVEGILDRILAAQEEDGFLISYYIVNEPDKRWQNLRLEHQLYNAGHFFEMAVAHNRLTGQPRVLNAAKRFADHIDGIFGPGKRYDVPGHEEIELALVKLYRETGERRYLELSRFFLDERGHAHGSERKPFDPATMQPEPPDLESLPETERARAQRRARNSVRNGRMQDHKPLVEQDAIGHAVRAGYVYSAMADVARLMDAPRYEEALDRIWDDVVGRKMYVTGGIGTAQYHDEGFGDPYLLPNRAYSESCAGIAHVLWQHRMHLLKGHARYIDVMELALFNGAISGIALSGDAFFYQNPLVSQGARRSSWIGLACCPTNLARIIPQASGFAYTRGRGKVCVNLYGAGEASIELEEGGVLRLAQETEYPWDGRVRLTVTPERPLELALCLRIPGWALGRPVPSDLYRFVDSRSSPIRLEVNGQDVDATPREDGYVWLSRRWEAGDVVELGLPLPVRRVLAHERVEENRGKICLMRGPIVYCLEAVDHPDVDLRRLTLPRQAVVRAEHRPDLLGGVTVLRAEAPAEGARPVARTAVPYYAWANRERGAMTVWIDESAASE